MKRLYYFGLTLFALGAQLCAQEVIILGDDAPAARATRRANSVNYINAQILIADGRSGNLKAAVPDDTFYDGQRFRLRVTADSDGHLYVLCLNSQGTANVVFPTPNTDALGSQVGRRGPITIPDSGWFQFDSEPGVERLFLLVSANPLDDLEQAIDQGGALSAELLRRYSTGRPSRRENAAAKGLTYTGADILVRKLELIHESRN